ncbi:hypothetical protein ACI78V_02425 [Geodermatophilus sp. SYSU D00742]
MRVLHLRDPAERREQYVESLRHWMPIARAHGATVVLYENSGEDLEQLARDAFGSLPEDLHLRPVPVPDPSLVALGKGATEAAMMDQFAATYRGDAGEEVWVKCTGRLVVRNFGRCLPLTLPPCSFAARLAMSLDHMDTRFFAATAAAWRDYLTGAGSEVDGPGGVLLEHVLARRVLTGLGDGATLVRLRAQPDVLGRSGSHAERRYDSARSRLQRLVAEGIEWTLRGPLKDKHF